MRQERNWTSITNGRTFEALAATIVFFGDPGAALFGRPGADGGQDIRSGDDTIVYQAKHHVVATAAKAIADAKKEAAKIIEYRQVGHARHKQWVSVSRWRLVTNAAFNATDRHRWDNEVIPLFNSIGLIADYWGRTVLNALLVQYPEIDRAFFGGGTRVFLTLPEVRARGSVEPEFVIRAGRARFRGRDSELKAVLDFVESDKLFLVIHGAGGIGKTRLLLESGEHLAMGGTWQILWANVASMEATGDWYSAVVRERKTLLLVDEPDSESILRRLLEQLRSPGGATQWKVAIALRSPKDPVLQFLQDPKIKTRVYNLPVGPLANDDSVAFCSELLASGPLKDCSTDWREETAGVLTKRFDRHPVWLGLAVYLLEEQGNLNAVPDTVEGLADKYIDEVVEAQQKSIPQHVTSLLRWIALLGTVAIDNESTLRMLSQATEIGGVSSVKAAITRLVHRRALVARGAQSRLIELKPDVLRDHVLRRWLTVNIGFDEQNVTPSSNTRELLKLVLDATYSGSLTQQHRAILVSLGRTELLLGLAGHKVDLLTPYFDGIIERLESLNAGIRISVTELLTDIADVRPDSVVETSRAFRDSEVADYVMEFSWGKITKTQADVVLGLAWPVFHAAMGAITPEQRLRVLDELCALVTVEEKAAKQRPRGLPNDGKRAAQLIERTLSGGPGFWGSFEAASQEIGTRMLNEASIRPLNSEDAHALKAIIKPAISVERSHSWSEGHAIKFRNYIILPEHPAWKTRVALISRVQELLADATTPLENRCLLWKVFAFNHTSSHRGIGRINGDVSSVKDEQLTNLEWALSVLSGRENSLSELTAARELWNWHRRFEDEPARKCVADALEELYESNDLAAEFDPLVSQEEWEKRGERALNKAKELARAASTGIDDFIQRGLRFLGADRFHELRNVGAYLGEFAQDSKVVRDFIKSALAGAERSPRVEFAAIASSKWVWVVRAGDDASATVPLITDLLSRCGSASIKILLARKIYGNIPPSQGVELLTAEEHTLLRSLAELFLQGKQGPAFLASLGWTFSHDWSGFCALVDCLFDAIPDTELGLAVNTLSDSMFWGIRDLANTGEPIPVGVGTWLLDQLVRVPEPDDIGRHRNLHWRIKEILEMTDKPDIVWLVAALERRSVLHGTPARVLHRRHRLSQYVRPISPDDALDLSVKSAVIALIDHTSALDLFAYSMQYIADVDPQGVLVPGEVVGRLDAIGLTDTNIALRLARVGGAYPFSSEAWRTIARPVVALAIRSVKKERVSLFHALTDSSSKSWSSMRGEVPKLFIDAVRQAREMLAIENDSGLVPFWQWNLKIAEYELNHQEERAKEDRGE